MTWQSNPYTIPLIIASMASVCWAVMDWYRYRHWQPARIVVVLVLAASTWTLGDALQLASTDPDSKLLWFRVQTLGAVWISAAWFALALSFTGRSRWLDRGRWILLTIVPLATIVLAFLDRTQPLIYQNFQVVRIGRALYFTGTYGPVLVLFSVYANILQFIAGNMFVQLVLRTHPSHWRHFALIIVCYAILIGMYVIDLLNQSPAIQPRMLPLIMLVLVPVGAGLFNRVRRADIAPIARQLLIDKLPDPVILLDAEDLVLDLNPAAQSLFKRSLQETLGYPVLQLSKPLAELIASLAAGMDGALEVALANNSERQVYDVRATAMTDRRRKVIGRVFVLREITDRVDAETHLRVSLDEKEVLLKEIHHRVKNNLQIISSLLNLQSGRLDDPLLLAQYQDMQTRVRSMALIHERLYRSDDLAHIDFGCYLRDLTSSLAQTYGKQAQGITVTVEADTVLLDIDTAIPCGLLVNELVSNALKHAFPNDSSGCVAVELRCNATGQVHLAVQDNGLGFPASLDYRQTASLGLQLVNSLARQLDATVALASGAGTRFEISFAPMNSSRRSP